MNRQSQSDIPSSRLALAALEDAGKE